MNNLSIHDLVKQYRKTWGYSLKEFSKKTGINHNMLCRIEKEDFFIPLDCPTQKLLLSFFKLDEKWYLRQAYEQRINFYKNKLKELESDE